MTAYDKQTTPLYLYNFIILTYLILISIRLRLHLFQKPNEYKTYITKYNPYREGALRDRGYVLMAFFFSTLRAYTFKGNMLTCDLILATLISNCFDSL